MKGAARMAVSLLLVEEVLVESDVEDVLVESDVLVVSEEELLVESVVDVLVDSAAVTAASALL